jgi:hypothetical protein
MRGAPGGNPVVTKLFVTGSVAGLLQLFDPGGYLYGYEHLTIRDVAAGRANFDVVSLAEGAATVVAQGEFIQNPPIIVLDVLNLPPASLVPQPLTLSLILEDGVFRLPAGAGKSCGPAAVIPLARGAGALPGNGNTHNALEPAVGPLREGRAGSCARLGCQKASRLGLQHGHQITHFNVKSIFGPLLGCEAPLVLSSG